MPALARLVSFNADRIPERLAVVSGDTALTWRDLERDVAALAGVFAERGLRRGDRLGLIGPSDAALVTAYFAGLRLGAIVVPLNMRLAAPELAHVVRDAQCTIVAAGPSATAQIAAAVPTAGLPVLALGPADGHEDALALAAGGRPAPHVDLDDTDDAMIIYTSGTTGVPKGVTHTHHSCLWSAMSLVIAVHLGDGERFLHIAPMYHAGGVVFLNAITAVGGTHFLPGAFTPAVAVETIAREQITSMFTVPTVLSMMLGEPALPGLDLSSWRTTVVGGAPVSRATLEEAHALLPDLRISQLCGQTESGPIGIYSTPDQVIARPDVTGHQPQPFIEARVVDTSGVPVAPGGCGELVFRGESIMRGYWRRPEETADVLRDGWLHTGDVVRVEADGGYVLIDRLRDMIITGGRNVFSVEVEQAVVTHPGVAECAVIGRPDPLWGESIIAVIAPRPGAAPTLQEIREHCVGLIASYKLPRDVVLSELPRNAAGKILKARLREAYGATTESAS